MTETIGINCKKGKLNILDGLFVISCLFPFLIPNPIVVTNIQPYAAIFATLIIFFEVTKKNNYHLRIGKIYFFAATWMTLVVAVVVFLISGITVSSFRAFFNYYSVAVIPLAVYLIIRRIGYYPENLIKALIIVWFAVSSIQFFFDRAFLTSIIGGVRFSYSYRGVVGLASEPSFLGISCFYFLHLTMKFQKNQNLFFVIILIMGTLYAQSMMGVFFIVAFLAIYLLEMTSTKKGFYIWLGSVTAVIAFLYFLNTVLTDTRLYQLFSILMKEGMEGVLYDTSAGNRYESIVDAIKDSLSNYLLPLGFKRRIGSGYGGFLCELGFFALPVLWHISHTMSYTFQKRLSKILYFWIVTVLLFNNTQIGNPLLLFVLGINLAAPAQGIHRQFFEKGREYETADR